MRGIIALVIRRFYVHNFRCLENFELPLSRQRSVLLIGNNGSGKTTVGLALEILQKIARGTNRVGELVKPTDFFLGRADAPMRFEIEVELDAKIYGYTIAFELLEGAKAETLEPNPNGHQLWRVVCGSVGLRAIGVYQNRRVSQAGHARPEGHQESSGWHGLSYAKNAL
jgi:energy-coupling factor transporter ATP-binding protein EcfA2